LTLSVKSCNIKGAPPGAPFLRHLLVGLEIVVLVILIVVLIILIVVLVIILIVVLAIFAVLIIIGIIVVELIVIVVLIVIGHNCSSCEWLIPFVFSYRSSISLLLQNMLIVFGIFI